MDAEELNKMLFEKGVVLYPSGETQGKSGRTIFNLDQKQLIKKTNGTSTTNRIYKTLEQQGQ